LSVDQFLAMQRVAQDVANQQFRRALMITNNLIISVVALLSTAFALVTALAWNRAVSDWLPTVPFLTIRDPLLKEFAYAGLLTIFVIVSVGVLGLVTQRLEGRNLMNPQSKE
jgi:uncharacterized membrane protein